MKGHTPAAVSFWRFNLTHELVATSLAALALLSGSWFTLNQLEQRYVQLHRSEAERVGQMLQEHLFDARDQLDRFATLPPQRQHETSGLLLPAFSDLYRLNSSHRVMRALKGTPGSRVFPGFSFAGSHLQNYIDKPATHGVASSMIEQGLEDERASIYFISAKALGGPLLARLDLSYLQEFLTRHTQASGLPVLLVSRHGFVLLSSNANLRVAAVDLSLAKAKGSQPRNLRYQNRDWQPLVANDQGLGGHIVILIPIDELEGQRRLVLLPSLVVGLLALLTFAWKNRRLHQLLFSPVAHFSDQIERLRSQVGSTELALLNDVSVASRFRELTQIETSFKALMQSIRERDLALQQKLRTSLTAAAIAHEINLPLSTIRMRCQQANRQLDDGPLSHTAIQDLVQALQADSQQVSRVIEKMRMLLRNVQTELVPTDLGVVVNSAITLLKRQLREQDIQLRCEGLLASAELTVLADAVQLQMALTNLLRNAIEAVAEQPVTQRQVVVSLGCDQGQVLLGVADSGPGFCGDPEADTLLRSHKSGGSGLGLFVVRTTLTNHGGRLKISRSTTLGGAEVCMQLPLPQQAS